MALPSLELAPSMGMRASPQLCLFSGLLALASDELTGAVDRELAANPALVRRETCSACGRPNRGFRRCSCGRWRGLLAGRLPAPDLAQEVDGTAELLSDVVAELGGRERPLIEYLLADLDGRGMLDRGPEEIGRHLGLDPERVRRAVETLRRMAPPGVGASGVVDCLERQLDRIEEEEGPYPLVRSLLRSLDDAASALAAGRLVDVASRLGVSVPSLEEALAFVRERLRPPAGLSPRPGLPPPPPDLELRKAPMGGVQAVAVNDVRAELDIDPLYRGLAAGAGPLRDRATEAERADACRWAERAQQFLHQLDRRRSTIETVATAAVNRQAEFLRQGSSHHRPLTRAALAAELGMHQSTVSRAVKDKSLRLEDGRIVSLATLFGRSTSAVETLRILIAERPVPGTDSELAAALAQRGFPIARRTVAKYRHLLELGPDAGEHHARRSPLPDARRTGGA